MFNSIKRKLIQEYNERLNRASLYLPLLYMIALTYDRNPNSKESYFVYFLRRATIPLISNICGITSILTIHYLSIPEVILLVIVLVITNYISLSMSFCKRKSFIKLLEVCLDLDVLIGIDGTKFMRHILFRFLVIYVVIVSAATVFVGVTNMLVLNLPYYYAIIVGTFILTLYSYAIYLSTGLLTFLFLTMRMRYLNIALIKRTKTNPKYFAQNTFLFDGLVWRKNFDNLVTFHRRASNIQLRQAYRLIFQVLRQFERACAGVLFCEIITTTIGTMVAIQIGIDTFIIQKATTNDELRLIVVFGMLISSWVSKCCCGASVQMFLGQVTVTQQICASSMLDLNQSEKNIQLSESVFDMFKIHDPQISIYGMFTYNLNSTMKSGLALIMFVVLQFQYSVPHNTSINYFSNAPNNITIFL